MKMGLADLLKSEKAQDLLDKGLDFVKENVTEEAIKELIEKCKEMGLTENETVAKLVDKFDLAKDVAEKYLGKYLKK
jgi:DNA-binding transcriptional regulator YhcF (GntR family)